MPPRSPFVDVTIAAPPPEPTDRGHDAVFDEARALLGSAEAELREIEREIEHLGLGTHASCVVCGAAIEPGRLIASPTERRCAAHAVVD